LPENPNNVTSTFFNAAHLLPKDLRLKHGGAKLAKHPLHLMHEQRNLFIFTPKRMLLIARNEQHVSLLHIGSS